MKHKHTKHTTIVTNVMISYHLYGYLQAKPFPVSIPQHFSNLVILHLPAYEDGTDSVFRNVGI